MKISLHQRDCPVFQALNLNKSIADYFFRVGRSAGQIGIRVTTIIAITAALLGSSLKALAHTQSTAFLTLQVTDQAISGEWHLSLRDLEDAMGLDANEDGLITWEELRSHKAGISAYASSHLHITSQGRPGSMHISDLLVDNHSDGAYAVLRFTLEGLELPPVLQLNYQAFFDIDPKHRGLLRLEQAGMTQLAVFGPETASQTFELANNVRSRVPFSSFVNEGIWHIWRGYDHILFLLALLLPGVLRRRKGAWEPVLAVRPAIANVLQIVTAFTVAHSITLSLAALGVVQPPTKWIEAAIAASVVLAAFNNLVPFFSERGWLVAFGFGLLHGFGFANALRDLGLQHGQLALTLFGFNLGVEIGQLAIVALFLPIALSLRRVMFYPRVVLRLGSVGILIISATWLAERVLDYKWLPF